MFRSGAAQLLTGQMPMASQLLAPLHGAYTRKTAIISHRVRPFMVNYRVEDLHALVKALKDEGCHVLDQTDESEYGKFAWVIDPEGNKVELWQAPQGQ
jgi:predicted enzyme related to lactoylglutathione lyase